MGCLAQPNHWQVKIWITGPTFKNPGLSPASSILQAALAAGLQGDNYAAPPHKTARSRRFAQQI